MPSTQALPTPEVIGILRTKVARNPGDLESALMLGSALYQAGDPQGSATVLRGVLARHPDHHQSLLLLARAEARSGEPAAALTTFSRAQQANPDDVSAWQVAAALAAELRDWSELLRIGQGWTQAHAGSVAAWQSLSRAWFEESQFNEALASFDRVLELEPHRAEHLISAARMAIAAQSYDLARRHLDAAQQLAPQSTELLFAFCRWYHLNGELDIATEYCQRVLAAAPDYVPAYIELGILRQGRLTAAEIDTVARLFQSDKLHPENRVMLGFTLGDALGRQGDVDRAFDAWDRANAINHQLSEREGYVYRPAEFERELQMLDALFVDPVELEALEPSTARPVFVLGMPRSGTTLVETILASHSRVYGAGELPALYDIYEELLQVARTQGVEVARALIADNAASWRERYLAALPDHGGCDLVVDKQPLNFRCIGLIRALFPDAPIFFMRRQPMDVGLSIYRHKFAKSWPCAHRLADIGHYLGIHEQIFAYWVERYSSAINVVDYAELVSAPEAGIRALLENAGLEFEPACLEPHKTRRRVATFSSVQVQNPVSTEYSDRSAPYRARLQPLREALLKTGLDISA